MTDTSSTMIATAPAPCLKTGICLAYRCACSSYQAPLPQLIPFYDPENRSRLCWPGARTPEIQLLVVFEEGHVAQLDAVSRVYDP